MEVQGANKTEKKKTAGVRAPNFSVYEKQLQVDLVSKRKSILENNKTDGTSVRENNEGGSAVEFNSAAKVQQRPATNLRSVYENLKKNWKNAATEKVSVDKTGGGSSPSKMSAVDEEILALIAPSHANGELICFGRLLQQRGV